MSKQKISGYVSDGKATLADFDTKQARLGGFVDAEEHRRFRSETERRRINHLWHGIFPTMAEYDEILFEIRNKYRAEIVEAERRSNSGNEQDPKDNSE